MNVPTITQTIYESGREYGARLSDFIAELQEAAKKAPPEYQDKVKITIEAYERYGNVDVDISLTYTRPKNETELAQDAGRKKADEEWQRRQYEALKKKFGE